MTTEQETTAVHFVTVTSNGEDEPSTVKFECRGDRDSKCHSYPDCECEAWDDEHESEHPFVQHDDCWIQGWFDSWYGAVYEGEDCDDRDDNNVPRGMTRSGQITAHYDVDEYVSWTFVEVSRG